jgi:hypothetical protein
VFVSNPDADRLKDRAAFLKGHAAALSLEERDGSSTAKAATSVQSITLT